MAITYRLVKGSALTNAECDDNFHFLEDFRVPRTSLTGSALIPVGTTGQRDGSPVVGHFRFNTTLNQYEGYNGSAWGAVGGGATGAPGNAAFIENDVAATGNYTITTGKNAGSFGPFTVNDGVTITIPTGSAWTIV